MQQELQKQIEEKQRKKELEKERIRQEEQKLDQRIQADHQQQRFEFEQQESGNDATPNPSITNLGGSFKEAVNATNYQNHHTANIVGSHSINRREFSPSRDEGHVTSTGNGGVFGSESISGLLG